MLQRNEYYVIKKDGKYLVGCPYDDTSFIRFSTDKYDGYRDKDFVKMRIAAHTFGGKVMRFNPITGDITGGWR